MDFQAAIHSHLMACPGLQEISVSILFPFRLQPVHSKPKSHIPIENKYHALFYKLDILPAKIHSTTAIKKCNWRSVCYRTCITVLWGLFNTYSLCIVVGQVLLKGMSVADGVMHFTRKKEAKIYFIEIRQ